MEFCFLLCYAIARSMPADFTVEDGTGLADANAYITATEMREYFNDRGVTFSETDDELQLKIVEATDYVEIRFYNTFRGSAEFPETQALSFPRTGVYGKNGIELATIPTVLKNAVAEYAQRALTAPLLSDPTLSASVRRTRDKVGPLETEVEYIGGFVPTINTYTKPDLMMRELVSGGSSPFSGRAYR